MKDLEVILKRFDQPDEVTNFPKGKFEKIIINKMVLGRDKLATISGKCSQNQEFDISCKCGFDISTFSYSTIRLRIVLKNFSLYYLQPYNYYQSLIN